MKPYWESTLTVTEAQNFSENGVAVLGNPVMRDIIWDKNSPHPMMWITKGYKEADPENFRNRKGWVPDKPTPEYYESETVSIDLTNKKPGVWYTLKNNEWTELRPKPVNTKKWKLDEAKNVWRYEKNGNFAEVATTDPNTHCVTRLCIEGKWEEHIEDGWACRDDAMGYCEWQVENPDGPKLGWWGTVWRLCVLALLLFTCFSWPLYFFSGYCALSYIVMGYMLLTGELSTVGTKTRQILSGIFIWLFAPLYFAIIIIVSAIRPPIL